MDNAHKLHNVKPVISIFFVGTVLLSMGCKLFSVDYWVSRSDTVEEAVPDAQSPSTDGSEAGPQLSGEDCLESPGDTPCSLETCVVSPDQFSAKYEITSELYGKADPNNFSCCAGYQFTNNSGGEVMVFEHLVSEGVDRWTTALYSADDKRDSCSNYYSQHDDEITYWKGITEIVVIYANSHCDWITYDDPGLTNYVLPVTGLCNP